MQTYRERFEIMIEVILDVDNDIKPKEALLHIAKWMRYEFAILKHNKICALADRLQSELNEDLEAFRLRKELSKY